jgi:hypothetical protein
MFKEIEQAAIQQIASPKLLTSGLSSRIRVNQYPALRKSTQMKFYALTGKF